MRARFRPDALPSMRRAHTVTPNHRWRADDGRTVQVASGQCDFEEGWKEPLFVLAVAHDSEQARQTNPQKQDLGLRDVHWVEPQES